MVSKTFAKYARSARREAGCLAGPEVPRRPGAGGRVLVVDEEAAVLHGRRALACAGPGSTYSASWWAPARRPSSTRARRRSASTPRRRRRSCRAGRCPRSRTRAARRAAGSRRPARRWSPTCRATPRTSSLPRGDQPVDQRAPADGADDAPGRAGRDRSCETAGSTPVTAGCPPQVADHPDDAGVVGGADHDRRGPAAGDQRETAGPGLGGRRSGAVVAARAAGGGRGRDQRGAATPRDEQAEGDAALIGTVRSGTAAAIAAMPASFGCRWSPLSYRVAAAADRPGRASRRRSRSPRRTRRRVADPPVHRGALAFVLRRVEAQRVVLERQDGGAEGPQPRLVRPGDQLAVPDDEVLAPRPPRTAGATVPGWPRSLTPSSTTRYSRPGWASTSRSKRRSALWPK